MSVSKIGSAILYVLKVSSAAALVIVVTAASACRTHSRPAAIDADSGVASELDEYSATVVRTIEDGERREVEETRVAVAGEMTRQEWSYLGERRVLISRPDLGKSYLLAPDKKEYVESAIYPEAPGNEGLPGGGASKQKELSEQGSGDKIPVGADADPLDGLFATAPAPTQGSDSQLPGQTVEGHLCKVWEHRVSFPEGHSEVTRTFRASDLSGLAIRIETESIDGGRNVRVTTERRDVRTKVSPDEFAVPPGFNRVDALDHK